MGGKREVLERGPLEEARPADSFAGWQVLDKLRSELFGRPREKITVGRYVLLERLAKGGAGVVYAAFDPELDRDVAIKLLQAPPGKVGDDHDAQARLLREAQAIARLTHPNVIDVYDVGTYDNLRGTEDLEGAGDQAQPSTEVPERGVFMVLELVDGQNLSRWLRVQPRSWREVLDVFVRAGRGLAAAHAAALVHRDFKPSNVLLGKDGRVRVLDFGLVRAVGETPTASGSSQLELDPAWESSAPDLAGGDTTHSGASALGSSPPAGLTLTGAIMGTPRYMSPEQHEGRTADASSDQFSFCVALYEALFAEPPFGGRSAAELGGNKVAGRIRPEPKNVDVPRWLRRALLRGLSTDPAARWPSMHALLGKLAAGSKPRRWRWVAVAGTPIVVGAALVGLMPSGAVPQDACIQAEQRLEGVWDARANDRVRNAMFASSLPFADDTWSRVQARLDRQAQGWLAMVRETCESDRETDPVVDAKMACLSQRLDELQAFVGIMAEADRGLVERAAGAAAQLRPVSDCADAERLQAGDQAQPPPEIAERVEPVRAQIVQVEALELAGRYQEGVDVARAAVEGAKAIDWGPLRADAWWWLGAMQDKTGEHAAAEQAFAKAYWIAGESEYGRVHVNASISMMRALHQQARFEEAQTWARHAIAAIERCDCRGASLASLYGELGAMKRTQGRLDEALAYGRRAVATSEHAYGDDHINLAIAINNLGNTVFQQGKLEEAWRHYDQSLRILEAALGPSHPTVAGATANLAMVVEARGRYAEARTLNERALKLLEASLGPGDVRVAYGLINLGTTLEGQGELGPARAYLLRARALFEKTLGPAHPNVAACDANLAAVANGDGRHDDAVTRARAAIDGSEASLDPNHLQIAHALTQLGKAQLGLAQPRAGVAPLERALAIQEANPGGDGDRAETSFFLAQALWNARRDRARAVELANEARGILQADASVYEAQLTEIDRWLAGR